MEFDLYNQARGLGDVGPMARAAEEAGVSGLWFTESKHNPFLGCAVAATAAERLTIGTGVAIAFPRSPMVTAQVAWDLAAATGGRFVLGLGTQVRAHIERRFSAAFDQPVRRLAEYVRALRAIFRAFQGEAPLKFEGDFYRFSLLTDFFSPGPIEHPHIPVYVAGVNRQIARMAGELCDGFHVHPLHSRRYLAEVVRPAITEGARDAGRDPAAVALACPVFIVVGDTEEEREPQRLATRRQLAFYGSTPTYRAVFELHGFHGVGETLHRLQKEGDSNGMAAAVTDEMLEAYAVTATWDGLPGALLERYGGVVDRVFPYSGQAVRLDDVEARQRWAEVARRVRAG